MSIKVKFVEEVVIGSVTQKYSSELEMPDDLEPEQITAAMNGARGEMHIEGMKQS